MSDQPENTQAETTELSPVELSPVVAPVANQAPVTHSNKRAIWAAVIGAGAVLLLVLAGLVGFALGSHHDDHGRGDFGRGQLGQMMHDFHGDRPGIMGQFQGPMMDQQGGRQFGGPMMGQQDQEQQGQGASPTPQTQQ
jgi:hypothetical protein